MTSIITGPALPSGVRSSASFPLRDVVARDFSPREAISERRLEQITDIRNYLSQEV